MSNQDGMNYAPKGKPQPVVGPGEFTFAAMDLEHGHIYGMCNGLTEAGATLKWVYDDDAAKVEKFRSQFPDVKVARSEAEVLDDDEVQMVAAAGIPSERAALGIKVMQAGKDYFVDKAPLTTLEQLDAAKKACDETGKKYAVYYSERLHVEAAVFAGQLIADGAIGRVVQTIGTGPHRLRPASRPDWFYSMQTYGGILCDIGSHQIEQFLYYTGETNATVAHSKRANYRYKDEYPDFDDFGDATLVGDKGATCYFRVDWLTPDGLRTWGDGRTILLGTHGYIEMRKYIEVGREDGPDQLYLVNDDGEQHLSLKGKVGYPFFGELIKDCIDRTDVAQTQAHAFKAAELCVRAQMQSVKVE